MAAVSSHFGNGASESDVNPDAHLLQQMAAGDHDSFEQFYNRYSRVVYSLILRVLNDPKETEDVFQEAFVSIWEKAALYDSALGSPFNWAFSLARNKAIDRLRLLKRQDRFTDRRDAEEGRPSTADELQHEPNHVHDAADSLRTIVTTLPADQRQAIEMAFLRGMTQREIAEELQQPLGTVKARIRRGLLKMKACLNGKHDH